MTQQNVNAVLKLPGKPARKISINPTLENLQRLIGGYVQAAQLGPHLVVCDEEGALKGLDPNCFGLVGPLLFMAPCGRSLTSKQARKLMLALSTVG